MGTKYIYINLHTLIEKSTIKYLQNNVNIVWASYNLISSFSHQPGDLDSVFEKYWSKLPMILLI